MTLDSLNGRIIFTESGYASQFRVLLYADIDIAASLGYATVRWDNISIFSRNVNLTLEQFLAIIIL